MAPSETMPINQAENNKGVGQRLWDLFTKPASSITDRADIRQARTLSAFLLVFILLTSIRVLVGLNSGSYLEESAPFINIIALAGLLIISYGLSRTKYNAWGSGLAIISTIIAVYLSVIFRGEQTEAQMLGTFMWLVPALILGSAFFSWRTTLIVSAITLALILATPFIVPEIEMGDVVTAFSIVFVVSFLIVVVNRFRDQLEADRRVELNSANQELAESSLLLEQRVAERTQALQLATEISRVLSQITNVTELLQTSVETIRAQFDIYYVQIYLTDDATRSLTLAAGTGNIGRELTRRGHRLIVGSNSINGLATSEKRAVIVSDTAKNPLFRPNPLLPRTRSEMAIPLIIGDRVVGTLNIQGDKPDDLLTDNLPAFEAIAGQLAVAIENARLLSDAAEARAEVESYTRRITREGWSSYLDAVNRPSFVGFSFNDGSLAELEAPLSQTAASNNVAQVPIDVIGETVGTIQIEDDEARNWTADDLDLIQAVSTQVGQQIEMLRSLDEASQYRKEAERALRRVTHEAWLVYEQSETLANGYAYDQMAVKPITAVSPSTDTTETIHHNLSIHGEAVGELTVEKSAHVDEKVANDLVTAVADQLITHMENLRLSEQTESALAKSQQLGRELAIINHVVGRVSNATSLQESMQIIVDELIEAINVDQVRVGMLDNARTKITIVAEKYSTTINESALGLEIPLAGNTLTQNVIDSGQSIIVPDCQTSPATVNIREMLAAQQIQSLAVMPISIDDIVIGTVGLDILDNQKTISDNQIKLAETLILQASTAIQKARLFEQIEARVEELSVINEVAQIAAQQHDRRELLQAVHEQIRRIMTVDAYFITLYDAKTDLLHYPYIIDNDKVYADPPTRPVPSSLIYQVLQTNKPLLKNRTQAEIDELTKATLYVGDTQNISASLLYIPLLIGNEILGVLSVQTYQLNAYTQSHVELLSSIANHIAISLENNRLLENTQQAAKREQVLREMTATINTAIDAESVLQTAAREIGRAIGVETFVYLTPDTETNN